MSQSHVTSRNWDSEPATIFLCLFGFTARTSHYIFTRNLQMSTNTVHVQCRTGSYRRMLQDRKWNLRVDRKHKRSAAFCTTCRYFQYLSKANVCTFSSLNHDHIWIAHLFHTFLRINLPDHPLIPAFPSGAVPDTFTRLDSWRGYSSVQFNLPLFAFTTHRETNRHQSFPDLCTLLLWPRLN